MGGKYGNGERISRDDAGEILLDVCVEIFKLTERIVVCGSYRRMKDTCGDGDIVVLVPSDSVWTEIMETLAFHPLTRAGQLRKGVFIVRDGFQIDIARVKDECEMGAMLLFATGSGEFNQATRTLAKRKGYKLNRYGLWNRETDELAACGEAEILEALGLGWIPPVERTGWAVLRKKEA